MNPIIEFDCIINQIPQKAKFRLDYVTGAGFQGHVCRAERIYENDIRENALGESDYDESIPDETQYCIKLCDQDAAPSRRIPYLSDSQLCFICGPTHAEEVGHGQLTYLTLACQDVVNTRVVGEKLKTPFIRIGCQNDIKYLERSSVLKNIYAVMVGIAVGMGYGDNFISVLVANCIKEMYFLLDPHSINELTRFSPSNFFGDLLVSCYSSHSRNRQLGVLIGRGNTVKTALNEMTMVAEGYFASAMMPYLPEVQRTHLPIAETAYQVLHKGVPARKAMKNLENLLA